MSLSSRTRLPALALLLLALPAPLFAQDTSAANPPSDSALTPADGRVLREKITSCLTIPPGLDARTAVRIELDSEGKLVGRPEVVDPADDATGKVVGSAVIRAIVKCAPYPVSAAGTAIIRFDGSGEGAMTAEAEKPLQHAQETSKAPGQNAAADLLSTARFGDRRFRLEVVAGLCAVDPDANKFEREIWKRVNPPPQRQATLIALQVDCETLERIRQGWLIRPQVSLQLMAQARPAEVPARLDAFLADRHRFFVQKSPPTDRFWQKPPVEGQQVTGLDERAIYFAQRGLDKRGKISLAGITAMTMLDDVLLYVTLFDLSGKDLQQRQDFPIKMMRFVEVLHVLSVDRR